MTNEYFQSEPVVCNDRLKHFHSPQDQRESFHLTWAELGLKLQENTFTGNHWAALESQNLYLSGGITKKILWVFSLIDLILPVEAVGRTSARTVRQTLQMSSEEKPRPGIFLQEKKQKSGITWASGVSHVTQAGFPTRGRRPHLWQSKIVENELLFLCLFLDYI